MFAGGIERDLWDEMAEVVAQTCSINKVFLEISQNLPENTSDRVSILIKFAGLVPATY